MPSRTPRYQVRIQNDTQDIGIPCMTREECKRYASDYEGTITVYDLRSTGLQVIDHWIWHEPATCMECEGSGELFYGGIEKPCTVCNGTGRKGN